MSVSSFSPWHFGQEEGCRQQQITQFERGTKRKCLKQSPDQFVIICCERGCYKKQRVLPHGRASSFLPNSPSQEEWCNCTMHHWPFWRINEPFSFFLWHTYFPTYHLCTHWPWKIPAWQQRKFSCIFRRQYHIICLPLPHSLQSCQMVKTTFWTVSLGLQF